LSKSSKADGSAKSGKGEKTVDAKAEKVGSSAKAEKMSSKLYFIPSPEVVVQYQIGILPPPYCTCTHPLDDCTE
jgi:hypothetical protein